MSNWDGVILMPKGLFILENYSVLWGHLQYQIPLQTVLSVYTVNSICSLDTVDSGQ